MVFVLGRLSTILPEAAVSHGHADAGSAQFPWRILRVKLFFMRTCIGVLAGLLGLWGITLAAEATKFSGTWEAASGDKVFLVLKLQAGEKISGTINAGSISMDDEGNLLEAGPVQDHEAPIFFAHADGDKLEFDFQDDDNEVMHFELKLTAENKAELRIVDKHLPKLKPFPLKKKG
jgi:hypothetical protein